MSVFDDLKNILKESREKKIMIDGIIFIKPYDWVDAYTVKIKKSNFVCDYCSGETDTYGVFCNNCQNIINDMK